MPRAADPELLVALLRQAAELEAQGDLRGALSRHQSLLKLEPRAVSSMVACSQLQGRMGNHHEQLWWAEQASMAGPSFATPWLSRGDAQAALGLGVQARASYLQALSLEPTLAPALLALSAQSARDKDYVIAVEYARRAVAAEPHGVQGWLALATILEEMGERESALSAAEKGLQLQPESVQARDLLLLLRSPLTSGDEGGS